MAKVEYCVPDAVVSYAVNHGITPEKIEVPRQVEADPALTGPPLSNCTSEGDVRNLVNSAFDSNASDFLAGSRALAQHVYHFMQDNPERNFTIGTLKPNSSWPEVMDFFICNAREFNQNGDPQGRHFFTKSIWDLLHPAKKQ